MDININKHLSGPLKRDSSPIAPQQDFTEGVLQQNATSSALTKDVHIPPLEVYDANQIAETNPIVALKPGNMVDIHTSPEGKREVSSGLSISPSPEAQWHNALAFRTEPVSVTKLRQLRRQPPENDYLPNLKKAIEAQQIADYLEDNNKLGNVQSTQFSYERFDLPFKQYKAILPLIQSYGMEVQDFVSHIGDAQTQQLLSHPFDLSIELFDAMASTVFYFNQVLRDFANPSTVHEYTKRNCEPNDMSAEELVTDVAQKCEYFLIESRELLRGAFTFITAQLLDGEMETMRANAERDQTPPPEALQRALQAHAEALQWTFGEKLLDSGLVIPQLKDLEDLSCRMQLLYATRAWYNAVVKEHDELRDDVVTAHEQAIRTAKKIGIDRLGQP